MQSNSSKGVDYVDYAADERPAKVKSFAMVCAVLIALDRAVDPWLTNMCIARLLAHALFETWVTA